MSTFRRRFEIRRLTDKVLAENSWLTDLLSLWRPAGDSIGTPMDRKQIFLEPVAIGDTRGLSEFLSCGQSIARVSFDRSAKLQAKLHHKYAYGCVAEGQKYVRLTSAGVESLGPYHRTSLDKGIENAQKHTSEEKQSVDEVVAYNPNIIDREMGLPAYAEASEGRYAPRMDLVIIEPIGNRWRVAFWEAKLSTNPSARCQGDANPMVCYRRRGREDFVERMVPFGISARRLANGRWVVMLRRALIPDYRRARVVPTAEDAVNFSMWRGYLTEPYHSEPLDWCRAAGAEIAYIHTSGHAAPADLRAFAAALKPKVVVPVLGVKWDEQAWGFGAIRRLADAEKMEIA